LQDHIKPPLNVKTGQTYSAIPVSDQGTVGVRFGR